MTPSVSASVPSQVESSPSASKPKQKIDPTPAFDHQSASPDSVKDPPEVVVTPPAVEAPAPDNLSNGGAQSQPPSQQGQRESVWQKLSNKIKSLERNVSLSSGYLEELSVKYKKQIEDLQLAVRQSGEALAAASKAREYDKNQVKDLKEEIGQLKVVVEEVSTRMETMSTWVSFITKFTFSKAYF